MEKGEVLLSRIQRGLSQGEGMEADDEGRGENRGRT